MAQDRRALAGPLWSSTYIITMFGRGRDSEPHMELLWVWRYFRAMAIRFSVQGFAMTGLRSLELDSECVGRGSFLYGSLVRTSCTKDRFLPKA